LSEMPSASATRLEFQRQTLWVGLFVLLAAVAFTAVSIIAVQQKLFRQEYKLHSSFERIDGLTEGADVLLRGFAVGRVTDIEFAMDPSIRFDVIFSVDDDVQLPAGTKVILTTRGFGSQILTLITPGDPMNPDAPPAPPPGRTIVFHQPGDQLPGRAGGSLDTIFSEAQTLVRTLSTTLRNVDGLLNERLGPELEATLATVNTELNVLVPELRSTLAQARSVLKETDTTMVELRPKASKLLDTAETEVKSAGDLARKAEDVLTEMEARFVPLADSLTNWIEQVDALLATTEGTVTPEQAKQIFKNLVEMSEDANTLVDELRKRPWRMFRLVRGEKKYLIEELKAQREALREAEQKAEAAQQDQQP
jgi:phospholipid/cholesterol/gamma-HCH transport system substrate-binding protein